MKSPVRPIVAALLASAVLVSPVFAKGPPSHKGKGQEKKEHANNGNGGSEKEHGKGPQKAGHEEKKIEKDYEKELKRAGITGEEARRYAKMQNFGGFKPLPPGIRKNLMRGKPLPPGLEYKRLPDAYLGNLPRYDGYEWRAYGSDLVLVSPATLLIADVIADVLD